MSIEILRASWEYLLARLGVDPTRKEGFISTEVAVLTVLLVGIAITVALIIGAAAENNANNIPQP